MKFSKAFRYSSLLAIVGVLTVGLITYVQQNILNTYQKNLPFIKLGDHIKHRATNAHLWFEELIAGDNSIVFDRDVLNQFKLSKEILQSAYSGGDSEIGSFEKPRDEETRVLLKQAIIDLESLTAAATERWQHKQSSSSDASEDAGGAMDQKFDAQYEKFQETMDALLLHVTKNVNADTGFLDTLSWVSVAFLFADFTFLCIILYRLQFGNDNLVAENSKKLAQESQRVETLSGFIEAVSAGNYDVQLQAQSEEDNLTGTLINMRNKLKQNAEDDRKRNWSTSGLAQIGEILRSTTGTSAVLYDNIIRFVIKYTGSTQGGLFLLNDDDERDLYLELVACYAFERKKFLTKRINIGDGLVGQCYLEGERIYLLEVPQDYVTITSGLGGENPNALLIVPLKVNEKIYGVLELASFKKFQDFEIDLVEKLAENIASTISTVRVNETTRILLEKTQQQAEEMKSQEEEIRQNMEELEATQEEMRRKQSILERELEQSQHQAETLRRQEKQLTESQETLQAIIDNIPRAIFWKDRDLRFMGCNKIFASVAGATTPAELIGKTDFDMPWSAQADAYRKDDLEVMLNKQPKLNIEEANVNKNGEESWVLTSKVPIMNQNHEVVAILGMFEDITERKLKEADIANKLKEREQALHELGVIKKELQLRNI